MKQNGSASPKFLTEAGFAPLLILVGVLVIATLAGGAYYLQSKEGSLHLGTRKPETPVPSPSPVVTSQAIPSDASPIPNDTGETSNWKTYTNKKVGFQIKYPNRYSQPGLPSGLGPTIFTDGSEDNVHILFGDTSSDRIGLQVFPFTASLDELLGYNETPSYDGNSKLTLVKNLKVDGSNALWYIATPPTVYLENEGKVGTIKVYFIGKNHGFILDSNIDHSQNEIDQILSTFRFD